MLLESTHLASRSRASLVAQVIKKLLAVQGTQVRSLQGSGRSLGGENGNPLQYSCLENPMYRGTWWATVHGSQRVGHDWATACTHALVRKHAYNVQASWSSLPKARPVCYSFWRLSAQGLRFTILGCSWPAGAPKTEQSQAQILFHAQPVLRGLPSFWIYWHAAYMSHGLNFPFLN